MKKFIADPSFWELFPDAAIGVLTVKDVSEGAQLAPKQAAEVTELLKNANAAALAHLDEGVALSGPAVRRLLEGMTCQSLVQSSCNIQAIAIIRKMIRRLMYVSGKMTALQTGGLWKNVLSVWQRLGSLQSSTNIRVLGMDSGLEPELPQKGG